jgi:flagellar biogenesis protein FliO
MTKAQQPKIDYSRYFMVVGIMAVLIIILIIVKRKLQTTDINIGSKKSKAPKIEVIYQKGIDMKTKVSLVQIGNVQYLILSSPNTYLLLDKFEVTAKHQKEMKRAEFDSILSANEQSIQDALGAK